MFLDKAKRFFKSDCFIALAFTAFTMLVCYILSGFTMRYCSNDGYTLSFLVAEGDERQLFLNYFLTALLIPLQKLLLGINIFVLSEVLLCFGAFWIINYCFLKKFSKAAAFFFMSMSAFLFADLGFVFEQFNQMTVIMAAGGLLGIFASFNLKGKSRIILRSFGIAFTLISSCYRFTAFEMTAAVFAVFVFCVIVISYWKQTKLNPKKKGIFSWTVRKYALMVVTFCLVGVVSLGGYWTSEKVKNMSEDYGYYYKYNVARSSSIDYERAPYEENEDFYNSLGYNNNDIVVLDSWFGDESVFTAEKMQAIADYSARPEMKLRFSVYRVLSDFKNGIEDVTGLNPYFVVAAGSVLLIALAVVLFIFRNKLKYLFPVILTVIWAVFLWNFPLSIETALAFPIGAFICITAFFCNRYYYFAVSVMSAVLIALVNYLHLSRINFRSTIVLYLTITVCVFYLFGREYIRCGVKGSSTAKRAAAIILSLAVVCPSAVVAERYVWDWFITIDRSYNEALYNRIDADKSNIYTVCGTFSLGVAKNYDHPMKKPEIPDNVLLNSSWLPGSGYIDRKESQFGVTNPYRDLIDNDKMFLVINNNYLSDLSGFYNDHYADYEGEISIEIQETVGDDLICSVKTS